VNNAVRQYGSKVVSSRNPPKRVSKTPLTAVGIPILKVGGDVKNMFIMEIHQQHSMGFLMR